MDLQRLLQWMTERGAQLSVDRGGAGNLVFYLTAYPRGSDSKAPRWRKLLTSRVIVSRRKADLEQDGNLFVSTVEKLVASVEEAEVKVAKHNQTETPGRGQRHGAAEGAADDSYPDPDYQV